MAYADFAIVSIEWSDFAARWVPGLERDGLRVGVNWSGPHATGHDVEPRVVLEAVEAQIARLDDEP